ncbi:WG repeat-containing protein [Capnocytophaga catalasegens]|uniref:WG repeat-containing protein n=1 Tax=Capnocytophaga catalasegens TaxID=1004260 RepID=A0AAV5ATC6_9FLAO|nr:WG repeat-containing protein [Capnocytophaga catalasegens]GIZ14698.1 hypothetical protein RCZ03_06980 [Capnocytophaga catalasegens]GJM50546.1 hypothetical protein RCZ15_15190 [Capnocytophaga catalasegens]GJM53623.1 hypothetical protein RCZ16_19390 [Capnocytophaga catalasegens]
MIFNSKQSQSFAREKLYLSFISNAIKGFYYDNINTMYKKLTLLILLLGVFSCKTKQEEYSYDAIGDFYSGYAPVFRDNFTGIIDSLGNVILPCEYISIKKIWEAKGFCTAIKMNNKNEEITEIFNLKTGEKILSSTADDIDFYDNGWIVVRSDYDMVYDYEGKVIVPEKYTDIGVLDDNGYIRVTIFDRENGIYYYGYIDKNGNEKIPPIYTELPSKIEKIPSLLKVQKNGLYGYIDTENNERVPIKYDDLADMSLEYSYLSGWCQKDGKYGYIEEGKEVIPPIYEDKLYNEHYRVVAKNSQGKYGIFDVNGTQLTDFKWDEVVYQIYTIDVVRKDGKYVLHKFNADNKEIEYSFDEAVAFDEDWIIAKKNGKWGMVSLLEEKILIPYEYDTFEEGSEYIFTKNGEKYVIDFDNKYTVKPFNDSKKAKQKNNVFATYDNVQQLDDKHFIVTQNNKKGVINAQGKITVPIAFENVYDRDKDNTVLVTKGNEELEGIYDYVIGKELLPCKYYRILDTDDIPYLIVGEVREKKGGEKNSVDFYSKKYEPISIGVYDNADYRFFHTYLIVDKGGFTGVMDKNGKEIVPCKYRIINYDYDLKAFKVINHGGAYGLYDGNGKMHLPLEYDYIGHKAGNVIYRDYEGKAGVYNLTKGHIIPCKYEWYDTFYSYILAKHENGKLLWFDGDGKQLLQFENADIHNFTENSVIILDNQTKKTLFMNEEGKILFEKDYTQVSKNISSEGLMAVQKKQKWGFMNLQGEEVIPCIYDEARRFWNGIGKVKTKGKWMFINNKGEILPNVTAKEENDEKFW